MSEFNLKETLKAARTPDHPEEYWEDFPDRVVRELGRSPALARVQSHLFPRLAWGMGLAAVCLIVGFAIGHRQSGKEAEAANGILQNEKVIRETMAMFPNRLRAIVQDEHGLSLVLADNNDVPTSTPLYVKICDGTNCSTLVTFSGQEIEVAGQKITVLSDAQGGVILVGERFLWASDEPERLVGQMRIEAKELRATNAG